MQRVPASARLGRNKAGLHLGYRVLTLNRDEFSAFTTNNVAETMPGYYVVTGGVDAPDAGGYVSWGTTDQTIAESEINPAPVDLSAEWTTKIEAVIDLVIKRVLVALPSPVVQVDEQVDLQAFEAGVTALRSELVEVITLDNLRQAGQIDNIYNQIFALHEVIRGMDNLNESAVVMDHLDRVVQRMHELSVLTIADKIEALRAEIEQMNESTANALEASREAENLRHQRLDPLLGILNDFLTTTEESRRHPNTAATFREASVNQKWSILESVERRLQRALGKAFRTQGQKFIKNFEMLRPQFREGVRLNGEAQRLREAITADDWLRIFDQVTGETRDLFFEPIQYAASLALERGAAAAIADVGIDFAFMLQNPRAVDYLNHHGYGLISQIDAVTRGNIATIISHGAEEGWSYDRMAREITRLYSQMAVGKPQQHIDSRAHLIAVTEIGDAYEAGSAILIRDLQDAGLPMEKKWLTVGDDRVSDGCQANADEGWIPFERAHQSGHMNPLRFPGCRCTELYQRRH